LNCEQVYPTMSGRGKGNFRSRDHRRNGPGRGANKSKPAAKKSVEDYVYYLGSSKQASDYETTTEYLINHIQQTFDYGDDIAESLSTLTDVNLSMHKPTLQVSSETDNDKKNAENKQFEMEFKEKFAIYMKRVEAYSKNQGKAFAFLLDRCSKGMKEKIQARADYETSIRQNPRELLKAIKQHALNYQESRYNMAIVYDAFTAVHTTTQKEGETLQDYTKRFRVAKEVLESHLGGPVIISKIAKSMPGYADSAEKKAACEKRAYEQYMAYVYMKNADQGKYGSILTGLSTQKSLGNEQYPKTITDATNVLSNHRFDNYKQLKSERKSKKDDKDKEEDNPKLSFAQATTVCYCCGKPNHKSSQCRLKEKIPKDEWAINKDPKLKESAQAHVQTEKTENNESKKGNIETAKAEAWAGVHFQFYQADEMRNMILLDNESTTNVFCNALMVENIRETPDKLYLTTSAGVMTTNLKATLPGWGDVWFDPATVTNILSYAQVRDRYRVEYNYDDDVFIVHLGAKDVKFERTPVGLYGFKPKLKGEMREELRFLTTLEENKTFYTPRQFERAKRARDLYHALGTPSIKDFKAMITINAVRNNPVTVDDIKIAEEIFGPDIGTLKGKTTRAKPAPVISDYIEIPRELIDAQRDVTLCMDAMKVNGLWFLTTISRHIYYRTAQYTENQTVDCYRDALRSVIQIYNRAGFQVRRIHCDNEFVEIMDQLIEDPEFDIEINYANPQEHVPEAERNNRVLKERVRAVYHRLPYNRLPRTMVKTMVSEAARKLNFFPAKYGVSRFYSPRMILHQQALDYDKHCKFTFGTYVQAHDEPQPTNTQQARTLDCIYLRPTGNAQGGHELFHIPTNRIIVRRNVTPIPITPAVLKEVEALAANQNMPNGLKIQNKTGNILFDSTWIAGVDFDEEEFDDESYDQDDASSDNEDDHDLPDEDYFDDNGNGEGNLDEPNDDNQQDEENDGDENNVENNEQADEEANDDDNNASDGNEEITNDNDDNDEEEQSDDDDNDNEEEQPEQEPTIEERPKRTRIPNKFLTTGDYVMEQHCNDEVIEYALDTAKVIARVLYHLGDKYSGKDYVGKQHAQTYSLKMGIKKFGERGRQAAIKELRQLHDRTVFEPVKVGSLSTEEKRRAMESLIFLTEKRDGTIKGRACANGSIQRTYIDKDDASSPTASTDAILLTGVIDAYEGRDVMTADIPNAFVQTEVDPDDGVILMKIRGDMVDYLVEIDPLRYADYVTIENNKKILYMRMVKALYGMLKSSLLYYKRFRKDIEGIGFKVNPYDPCVANRTVNGKQHTVVWHVDDLKSSHVDPQVNKDFLKWLNQQYADDGIAEVKATFGKRHDYLGMTLDYTEPGTLIVDMRDYVHTMLEEYSETMDGKRTCPWTEKLFKVDNTATQLDAARAAEFHTFVAKGLFLSKRGRQDLQPAISFLTTRVRNPNKSDWEKLKRMMEFLKTTKDDVMKLKAESLNVIKWYLDAAFAVHPDMKSHTGAAMTLGEGCPTTISTKQKTNSRSSTEAELISGDDIISKVLWTRRFMEAQGIQVTTNVIFRDNMSSMKLEENGKESSGKRTRHFDIKYFYITDLIKRKEVTIEYRPTDEMIADYMTKPLTGAKFHAFRKAIMGN